MVYLLDIDGTDAHHSGMFWMVMDKSSKNELFQGFSTFGFVKTDHAREEKRKNED